MGMPVGGRTGKFKMAEIEEKGKEVTSAMQSDLKRRDEVQRERDRVAALYKRDYEGKPSVLGSGFLGRKYQESRIESLDAQLKDIDGRLDKKREELRKLNEDATSVGKMTKTIEEPTRRGEPTTTKLTTVKTRSGQEAKVDESVQKQFQGFINDLEAAGYKIKDLQGFNDRNIAGTGTKSQHAYGRAIDVNPTANPELASKLVTDMPSNVSEIAKKWGLGWGGDWSGKKDPMHFSAEPREGGRELSMEETNRLLAEQNKKLDRLADTMADGNRDRKKIIENTR